MNTKIFRGSFYLICPSSECHRDTRRSTPCGARSMSWTSPWPSPGPGPLTLETGRWRGRRGTHHTRGLWPETWTNVHCTVNLCHLVNLQTSQLRLDMSRHDKTCFKRQQCNVVCVFARDACQSVRIGEPIMTENKYLGIKNVKHIRKCLSIENHPRCSKINCSNLLCWHDSDKNQLYNAYTGGSRSGVWSFLVILIITN